MPINLLIQMDPMTKTDAYVLSIAVAFLTIFGIITYCLEDNRRKPDPLPDHL